MAKICIMCDEPAGSHEHVFPAALGGRRTNKGIYCTPHNNGFGRHVAELEKQLALLNAILMVRPDRHDEPKPFVFADADGTDLSMVGQAIQIAPPPSVENLNFESDGRANLRVSSMEQFEKWRDTQRKAGWEVHIADSMEVQQRYVANSLGIRLNLGGKEALQAVGYLALTFFAQYFPAVARQKGLDPFKEFLKLDFSKEEDQHGWMPNLVWWDGRDAKDVVGENPFGFGHVVVVGISGTTNRAYAYLSFFSALNFGIDLGPVEDSQEGMVRAFIDPKAEKAPEDLEATRSDKFSIEIDPTTSDLGEMIRSGSAEAAMKRFFDKVGAWHFDFFVAEIHNEVMAWAKSPSTDRVGFAENLVEKHGQRVLNLLAGASTELKAHLALANCPEQVLSRLDNIIQSDESQPNGLSPQTNALLVLAKKMIAQAITTELGQQDSSPEQIALLLAGGPGVAVITKAILLPRLLADFSV